MATIKLDLTDCLADSPQTRALVGVFESDAATLAKYARGVHRAFERIALAQKEVTAATQALSQYLRDFDKQDFTLSNDNDYISSVLKEFAGKVDQVATYNAVLKTQIAENAAYGSALFVEKYLSDIEVLKAQLSNSDSIHLDAMKRLSKLSKKRINESNWLEASDHLHAARKGFHVTSMNYCAMLNILQSHKKAGLIGPLLGYVQSQVGYFQMGGTLCESELENYMKMLNESLEEVKKTTDDMSKESALMIDRIDAESTRAYIPDPPPSMNFPEIPLNTKKTQISGYLFSRSSGMFTNQWVQRYYFTQGGNLMQQGRYEVAGSLVMDLDGCTVGFADVDDRRYVFQILSQDGKNSVILQAESNHELYQWVSTITNISKGLYLANDPGKAAELMRAAAIPPEPVSTSAASAPMQADMQRDVPAKDASESGDFQSKHEQAKPSGMFARLKNAASSLVAPLNKIEIDRASSAEKSMPGNESAHQGSAISGLEAVVNSMTNYPVYFDIPQFSTQQNPTTSPQSTGAKSPGVQGEQLAGDSSASDVKADTTLESNFNATYAVRFIGCREVPEDGYNGYAMISETIRSVMAARALHNNFSVNELRLVLSDFSMRMVDPDSHLSRDWIAVSEIVMAANHRENPRLIGIIAKRTHPSTNKRVNMCYVYESDSDGADVCCSIATVQVMAQSLVEETQMQQQRELESDLEEQSRLLAKTDSIQPEQDNVAGDAINLDQEDLTMRDSE